VAGTAAQDEIRVVLDELLDAQNAADATRLRSMLSERPDAVHIGTDAGEWWTSKELVDAVAASGGDGGIRGVADDIDIHLQGDVAWVEGRARFTNPAGDERPVRFSGVLLREDDRWKVVQSHASIGVPNAEIFS
jgi:ketosteroid isomerase-like protein